MIIWESKPSSDTHEVHESCGIRTWVKYLDAYTDRERWAIHLGWNCIITATKWETGIERVKWDLSIRLKQWGLGYDCLQYDGFHHSITLGPFWLYWFT